jgi:hypothetical protein
MNRDRVREQVRRSRLDQGLPGHVTADRFLEELAAEVCTCPTCESQEEAAPGA